LTDLPNVSRRDALNGVRSIADTVMTKWFVLSFVIGVTLAAGAGMAWLASLPSSTSAYAPPSIPAAETEAMLAALQPPKRARPLIAVIGINDATETTDYLMPYGVLKRADVADVTALSTRPGPVTLFPALTVEPQATVADFEARHPDGADYLIVPAMSRDDDPAALAFIRRQAATGAIVIGVCAGAKVVAAAGLLRGRRGTTHWYYRGELLKKHPSIHYVPDRRLVVDRGVATTTGISASMPMALTLIAAIAGRERAQAVANDLGVVHWDVRHASAAFAFTRPFATTAIVNTLAVWGHEQLGIALVPGVDEVSLALVADAWSRTFRSRAVTFAATQAAVSSRGGIGVRPDQASGAWPAERLVRPAGERPPAQALDDTLAAITTRYGARTADFVAMQLEYPRPDARP
jgi:putative intracellular protease/amidase